ncbi:hypothetical protein LTR84_004109 [Exophiala bonariae]|uniref:DHHA2 domain-containing protein n=1 Tax=Exophiala bonariae TaxID=1690606 RepID=A0AAV9N594_9EURO|nr:hypothetical protein LTR84_004109 [Exophiala bonariae]
MADETTMPPLSTYLSRLRTTVFPDSIYGLQSSIATPLRSSQINNKNVTLVMGNPSADLDSFISAVVLSYFYNHRQSRTAAGTTKHSESSAPIAPTLYVPILNLPAVRSGDLWRQRPEFAVALKIALGKPVGQEQSSEGDGLNGKANGGKEGPEELEQVITIGDVKDDESSTLHALFSSKAAGPGQAAESVFSSAATTDGQSKQALLLVDHNSPSIPGLDDETIKARFNVVGCVDHHIDEAYVPKDVEPRVVTTGIGSCTSLVVEHLRQQGLWPEGGSEKSDVGSARDNGEQGNADEGLLQIAKLALAPILIDTSNLRARGDKCSDTDREAVRFLETVISNHTGSAQDVATSSSSSRQQQHQQSQLQSQSRWDRTSEYDAISTAKSNSLSLLTMQETFDRDYKAWVEVTTGSSNSQKVNIGTTSLVKPLSWLIEHAGGRQQFVDEIEKFALDPARELGVFAMLTRTGTGKKEAAVIVMDEGVKGVVEAFEKGGVELRLQGWEEDGDLLKLLRERFVNVAVWWMGDTSKSRKQVAPLLRDVVKSL